MSRRKITSPKALERAWESYKADCDSRKTLVHEFSSKNSEFVSARLNKCVTYTVLGFCRFIGISRASFYASYVHNPAYSDIAVRMHEECEIDAREKFELGLIPTQLSSLWMSKYGYTTKTETQNETKIQAVDELPLTDKLKLLADAAQDAKAMLEETGGDGD